MRSQYAKSVTETYVEFSFLYAGELYRVRRNPEYKIVKELKNGKLREQKVPAVVELTLPDGTVYPEKRSQTDAKIEELIGLTKEQFTQTAMIAQGDFLKLLYAKSDDRKRFSPNCFTQTHIGESRELKAAFTRDGPAACGKRESCRAGESARDSAARRTERTSTSGSSGADWYPGEGADGFAGERAGGDPEADCGNL